MMIKNHQLTSTCFFFSDVINRLIAAAAHALEPLIVAME